MMNIKNKTNQILCRHSDYAIYLCVSIIAIIWNILTMHNALPWCDEVMLIDPAAHQYFYGTWDAHAYNSMGDQKPFVTGLFLWLNYIWIMVFGFSFLSLRMFEISNALILGLVIIKLLTLIRGYSLKKYTVLIFSICFWFFEILAITYRMERSDIMGCMFVGILAVYVTKYFKEATSKNLFMIFLFSTIIFMSGLQAALYGLLLFIFALAFVRPIHNLIKSGKIIVAGYITGFMLGNVIYWYNGYLKEHIFTIIDASGTLHKMWMFAREYVLPMLGRNVNPIPEAGTSRPSFFENIFNVFDNTSMIVIAIVLVVLFLSNNPIKSIREKRFPALMTLLSLFIIVFFILAGRYPTYYEWTAIIPMIISLAFWSEYGRLFFNQVIAGLTSMVFIFLTIPVLGSPKDKTYNRIVDFCERQQFKPDDCVCTVFSTFYALKPKLKNAYWYEIYPERMIPTPDYIIFPQNNKDEKDYLYINIPRLNNYVAKYQDSSEFVVEKIDSIEEPALVLFKITKKK